MGNAGRGFEHRPRIGIRIRQSRAIRFAMRGLSAPATPGLQLPCGSITDPSQPLRDVLGLHVEGRRIQRIALSTTRCPNPAARPTGFTNRAGKCRSSRMRYRATNIWHVRPRQEAAASSARPGWDRLNTGGIERNKEPGAGSTVAPGPSSSGNSANPRGPAEACSTS